MARLEEISFMHALGQTNYGSQVDNNTAPSSFIHDVQTIRIGRIGIKLLELMETLYTVSWPVNWLASSLNFSVSAFGYMLSMRQIRQFMFPIHKTHRSSTEKSWQRKVSSISMVLQRALMTVRGFSKYFTDIGSSEYFTKAYSILVVSSGVFGIWDNIKKMSAVRRDLSQTSLKVKKWEQRFTMAVDACTYKGVVKAHQKLDRWKELKAKALVKRNAIILSTFYYALKVSMVALTLILSVANVCSVLAQKQIQIVASLACNSLGIGKYYYAHCNQSYGQELYYI